MSYARLRVSVSFTVGNGSGLERFVACCICNRVAVALAIDVMASVAALPQTIVQPGFLHNWQSRLGLVLHILPSGFGGAGQGTLQSAEEAGGWLY